jgi:branched-chain amino acid transport system ATP-binding protein
MTATDNPSMRPAVADREPPTCGATQRVRSADGREVPADAAVLSLQQVQAGYGTTTVLREVSLQVYAGQVVALLGPNGAGKTTIMRTASGIVRPTSGVVRIDGVEVNGEPPHRRSARGLCLIPEGRGIFRSLTVRENLRLQVSRREPRREAAIERAMAVFPALRPRMKTVAGHLSGGQQQMLALARAYVTQPKVILVDEVSMGLAPRVVEEMFQALRNLADAGIAMLIVEQYVTRAMAMSDEVVLLNKGSVSYQGPPSDLDEKAVLAGYLGSNT